MTELTPAALATFESIQAAACDTVVAAGRRAARLPGARLALVFQQTQGASDDGEETLPICRVGGRSHHIAKVRPENGAVNPNPLKPYIINSPAKCPKRRPACTPRECSERSYTGDEQGGDE